MKITKHMLKQLIKEELQNLTEAYPGQPGQDPEVDCPEDYQEDQKNRQIFGKELVRWLGEEIMMDSIGMPACSVTKEANAILTPLRPMAEYLSRDAIKEQVRQILKGAGAPGVEE